MLKKIISGGQSGAEIAALDVAINFSIHYSGWVPKGRIAEDGPISNKYQLNEMPVTSYSKKTEQNVLHADSSIIISHDPLSGSCSFTKKVAMKHGLPWIHVDLSGVSIFQAALFILKWIEKNNIKILNVTGPKASQDHNIYEDVTNVLEAVILLDPVSDRFVDPISDTQNGQSKIVLFKKPETVDETVDFLIEKLDIKYRIAIANSSEDELVRFYSTIGLYIGHQLLNPKNKKLLESCRQVAQNSNLHLAQAPMVIIRELWRRLCQTHRIRVVD